MTKPLLKIVKNEFKTNRVLPEVKAKRTFTQQPVQPDVRLDFNDWQAYLQREREKIAPKFKEARIIKLRKRA